MTRRPVVAVPRGWTTWRPRPDSSRHRSNGRLLKGLRRQCTIGIATDVDQEGFAGVSQWFKLSRGRQDESSDRIRCDVRITPDWHIAAVGRLCRRAERARRHRSGSCWLLVGPVAGVDQPDHLYRVVVHREREHRTAILLLLSAELVHGYQIMHSMSDRAGAAWHPSRERPTPRLPGSRTKT